MMTSHVAAVALIGVGALLGVACGQDRPAPTTPSESTITASPQPPQPQPANQAETFDVSGTVTDDRGAPLAGAKVTMAHYGAGGILWPSVVADVSGRYRIGFSGTVMPRGQDRFVARAEVVADGYELYWSEVTQPTNWTGPNTLTASFPLYPIRRVAADGSTDVSFPSDVGLCTGWLGARCGIVRLTIPAATGSLTVHVTPADDFAAAPTLEICCVSGNEIYGNPLTLKLDGFRGSEVAVLIGLDRSRIAGQSFRVRTSLQPN